MAVLKIACPKCGQRVSGDESFYGTTVDCPVCTSVIRFPEAPGGPGGHGRDGAVVESRPAYAPAMGAAPPGGPAKPQVDTGSISLTSPAPAKDPARFHRPAPAGQGEDLPSPVLGVMSMVLGVISVMLLCLPGILCGPAAIICGHVARSRARHSRHRPAPGEGAALAGLILGYLSLAGFILITLFVGPWFVEWIRSTSPPA